MRHVSVQQLSAFLDDALVGVSRELVARHLESCIECRERHTLWRAGDEVLRRVLSWEPDERTLEEWSSRVELTLTAERKGLPAPEFSELLHPVIAPLQENAAERMNSVVQSIRNKRRTDAAPASAAPASGSTPAMEPPAAEPAPVKLTPNAAETPEPPRARLSPPEPAPVRTTPVAFAPAEFVAVERALSPTPAPSRAPKPLAQRVKSALPAKWPTRALLLTALALVLALAGSPLVPEVILIPLPERWEWRLPRVEFVRRHDGSVSPSPAAPAGGSIASRRPTEPERVPVVPAPARAESSAVAVPDTSATLARAGGAGTSTAMPGTPAFAPSSTQPIGETQPSSKPRGETPGAIVPAPESQSVEPSSRRTPPPAKAAPRPTRSAAPEPGPAGPRACGIVLGPGGTPIEGARIVLLPAALVLHTDRRGRFCTECPPGRQSLRVEADGFVTQTRVVELTTQTVETRFSLSAAQ